MPTKADAMLVRSTGDPFEPVQVWLDDPAEGEVLVRIEATALCHSDVSIREGDIPHEFPVVLGHEAAGVVEAVGANVADINVDDRVALTWLPQCGSCFYCVRGQPQLCESEQARFARDGLQEDGSVRRRLADGTPVKALGSVGAFANRTVVSARACFHIPAAVGLEEASLLGCGALTGFGAVLNAANLRPGDSVAILGLGGVGFSALQGARLRGAGQIIAIDLQPAKQGIALANGATHFVAAGESDPVQAVRDLTAGRGADLVIEAVGSPATFRTAFEVMRPGGLLVAVGIAPLARTADLPLLRTVAQERTIRGSRYGSANLRRDIPRLLELAAVGTIDLSSLITARRGLDDLEVAVADLIGGEGLRTVLQPAGA